MASCLLCSATVGPHDVVCPHCGGAVDDAGDDPTTVAPPPGGAWITPPPPPGGMPGPTGWEPAYPQSPSGPTGWEPAYDPQSPPGSTGPATGPFGAATGSFGSGVDGPPPAPYGGGPYGGGPYGGGPVAPGPSGVNPYGANPYGPQGTAPPGMYPYGPAGATPYGAPYYVPAPKVPTEGLAVASLVTSIAGLALAGSCLVPILGCPVGAVMGHVAMRRIDASGKQGRGMAMAGAIVGWIGTALLAAGILFIVVLAASGDLS